MELKLEDLVGHLQKIKETQGEGDYRTAVEALVKQLLIGQGTESFLDKLLEALGNPVDLERLRGEAAELRQQKEAAQDMAQTANEVSGQDLNSIMINAVRQQMPHLKTQAQFDLVISTFEAMTHYLNASFGGDSNLVKTLRDGLNQALDLAPKLGEVTEKLQASPEATSNTSFIDAPRQYTENLVHEELMRELAGINSSEALTQWYDKARDRLNHVVSRNIRDSLFDTIRKKKKDLAN